MSKQIDLTNLETYYFYRNKYDKSFFGKLPHKVRLLLHPILLQIIKFRNKQAGFDIKILYDRREKTNTPKIFAITHIGKFDIEVSSEVIKDHYYLLSGDYENMKGTIEEKFLGFNGVVYIREDDKEDRKRSKQKMIDVLKKGGNMMYFPEGTWNLSPNLPVLHLPYGIIEVAMKSNAVIIPVGIEQYDNQFYVAIGESFDTSVYSEEDKIKAINELRDRMASLKWDIWKSIPEEIKMNKEGFEKHIENRLKEWNSPLEFFYESAFKPKNICESQEAFAHLKLIKPSMQTAFLFNKRLQK